MCESSHETAPVAAADRLLRLAEALDGVFDTLRNAGLEDLLPGVFAVLKAEVPDREFFVHASLPDYERREQGDLVVVTDRTFASVEAVLATARAALARLDAPPAGRALVRTDGCLLAPLRRRGGIFGWLGATPAEGAPADLEPVLATTAQRLDSELDVHCGRMRRRILATKLNRALEDYYLERGIRRALNLLLANGVCDGVYIVYDRSGPEREGEVISQFHWVWGVEEVRLTSEDHARLAEDPTTVPASARKLIAALADGHSVPLCRRDFEGVQRPFGCITFVGPGLDHSARMLLDEFANDLDSAMINYHEKRRELSRFLSPPVVRQLLEGDRAEIERRMAPRQQLLALGFADIVGYTRLCSRYPHKALQIATLLRDWKREMRDITFRHGGIVDKFIGDCLFYQCGGWSKDTPEKLVLDATAIALACAEGTERMGARMPEYGFAPTDALRLSIGIHIGNNLVVGDVGGEFTAIGTDVNVASRIQDHEFTSGRIVVSEPVRDLLAPVVARLERPGRRLALGAAVTIELKGVGAIPVYEVKVGRG